MTNDTKAIVYTVLTIVTFGLFWAVLGLHKEILNMLNREHTDETPTMISLDSEYYEKECGQREEDNIQHNRINLTGILDRLHKHHERISKLEVKMEGEDE